MLVQTSSTSCTRDFHQRQHYQRHSRCAGWMKATVDEAGTGGEAGPRTPGNHNQFKDITKSSSSCNFIASHHSTHCHATRTRMAESWFLTIIRHNQKFLLLNLFSELHQLTHCHATRTAMQHAHAWPSRGFSPSYPASSNFYFYFLFSFFVPLSATSCADQ